MRAMFEHHALHLYVLLKIINRNFSAICLCYCCKNRHSSVNLARSQRTDSCINLQVQWRSSICFVDHVKPGNYTYRGVSRTNKGMANMICWKSLQSFKALSREGIVAEPKAIPRALVSTATERLLLGMYSKTVGNEMTWQVWRKPIDNWHVSHQEP